MSLELDLDEREFLQLAPLAIGDKQAELAGFQAVAEHLQEEIKTERLKALESKLRQEVNAGNVDLMDDLGVIQMLLGKDSTAKRTFKQAIAAGSTEAFYPLGKIYYMQSHDARDENTEWNAAVNELREATQVDPQNAGAWLYLGKALEGLIEEESLQQVSIAYEHYLKVGAPLGQADTIKQFLISQDPELQRKESLIQGQEALADGEYPRSIAAFERAIQLGNKEAHFFLGTAFEAADNYARALDAYQRAYSLGIRPEEVAIRLGRTIVSLRTKPQIIDLGINAINTQLEDRTDKVAANKETEALKALLKQLKKMQQSPDK
ncbi:MAG: tetratricopeptide repeat protein [Bacteroidota bacterium]